MRADPNAIKAAIEARQKAELDDLIQEYARVGAVLTEDEQAELDALLEADTVQPYTFREFIELYNPRYKFHRAAEKLIAVLQLVADGYLNYVMVFEPPRHGKTELVTKLFPAYYLYRHSDRWVGVTAYSQAHANTYSRAARNFWRASQGQQADNASKAVTLWETGDGGGLWAAGIGGGATGKGGHLLIIDDPVKNAKEASSPVLQEAHREWFISTFDSRMEEGAALVVVMTRWHSMDLAGWLLSQELVLERPRHWHIVWFPMLSEGGPPLTPEGQPYFPTTCTIEDEWRPVGEPLWPARFPLQRCLDVKSRSGSYWWNALYQGHPFAREGTAFKLAWLGRPVLPQDVPRMDMLVRAWDEAASDEGGDSPDADWTAGVKMGRTPVPREHQPVNQVTKRENRITRRWIYYVLDVVRFKLLPGDRDEEMRRVAETDGTTVQQWGQQEPGSSGVDRVRAFLQLMDGFPAYFERVTGDKKLRFDPFAAAAQAGSVRYVQGDWNAEWKDELGQLWTGAHDDMADATASAYNRLAGVTSYDPREWATHTE